MGAKYVFNPLTGNLDTTDVVAFNGEVNLGTAAAPSVFFTGDTNTGIYSPGADQVAISTNGAGRLFIDSSGNLGLGTSSPNTLLTLSEDQGTTITLRRNNSAAVADDLIGKIDFFNNDGSTPGARVTATVGAYAQATAGGTYLAFSTATNGGSNAERFRIDQSGNVGIGTASPSETLTLNGAAGASLGFEYGGSEVATIANNNAALYITAGSGKLLSLGADGSEAARIDSSGRLLVGTSSARSNFFNGFSSWTPQHQVETAGGSSVGVRSVSFTYGRSNADAPIFAFAKHRSDSIGGTTVVQSGDGAGVISFQASDGTDFVEAAKIEAVVDGTPGANDMPGRLVFSTTADGAASPTERMRIDSDGKVGIGRSPTDVLDVYRSSGEVNVKCDSDSLSNGNTSAFVASGGARQATLGVFKHASITNPCAYLELRPEDNGANYLWVDNSDQFRISSNPEHIGTTNGTVIGTQTSDERIKNILGPVEYGLDTLKQIETVRFSLKSEPEAEKLGFIAQQVQPLVPESVFDTDEHIEGEPEDAPTKLGMEYVALIPVLVNAVKELSAEVDALKAQLQPS